MKIKICGITNKEDAINAISLGADAIGFIFSKDSPRYIEPAKAEGISLFLPPFVFLVGVFVNQSKEEIIEIAHRVRLDLIQLHGEEPPSFCMELPRRIIKAIKVSEPEDLPQISKYQGVATAILLDTKVQHLEGGTGKTFDWGLALKAKEYDIPLILAGGINATNVKKAVNLVNPYAIDLCSGVECEPGKKDYNKMQEIIKVAQAL
ncbi:MAG: phosphoribosylanthranilate isomerase [Candidatus Margulisiibacteriota bacterium]|jgi:phosphoribosylanthranilate isomerase